MNHGRWISCMISLVVAVAVEFIMSLMILTVSHWIYWSISLYTQSVFFEDLINSLHGEEKRIRSYNVQKYICDLMKDWCDQYAIEHVFTQLGHPQQNAYVERFNPTVRYECLNQYLFIDLSEAQDYTTVWQYFYNHKRPHMSVTWLSI